jgi:hypothetical protein
MDLDDLNDCPTPHKGFRRSTLVPNVKGYEVQVNPPLVTLLFDGVPVDIEYESGIKLHQALAGERKRGQAIPVRIVGCLAT